MSVLGSLQSYFTMGFAKGVGQMAGLVSTGGMARADFNQLYNTAISATKGGLEFKDLRNLEKVLKEVEPELFKKFKRDATKLGNPAKQAVQKAFRTVDKNGPLGPVRRPGRKYDKMATNIGRLSWASSRSKRNAIDINYKQPKAAPFNKAGLAGDKTLSLIRVRVRGGSYVMADMAGKSNKARKATGQLSRSYQINLFGKMVVTRRHKVNAENVGNWIDRLNSSSSRLQGHPSRYAWPALEKHAKDYQKNFSALVADVVAETNRKLNS